MDRIIEKLRQHKSATPSKWREEAECRQANLSELRKSREIAMRLLTLLRSNAMTKENMAKAMGMNQDTLDRLLRGKEIIQSDTLSQLECFLISKTCISSQDNQTSYPVLSDNEMICAEPDA